MSKVNTFDIDMAPVSGTFDWYLMETVTREFLIVLSKKDALVAELDRLAKRARRIGAAAIVWSFGAVEDREVQVAVSWEFEVAPDQATRTRRVPFIRLTLTGGRPKIAGWEFAATVQHIDGANVLRACPRGEELTIPDGYRTRGPVCDHCQSARSRRDTYLLVSDGGDWKQVGSSCLVDFLGHADPHALAEYAEILGSALALADGACGDAEGGWGFGGGGARAWSLVEYLTCVAAEIRESGWVPKSAVLDHPNRSTAAMAKDRMAPDRKAEKRDRSVLEIDRAVATASYEWALALGASSEHLNDYLWNLHAVAKSGIVEHRTLGLAASMVAAHIKAEARRREQATRKPSEHVGAVGESRSFALTLDRHFAFETQWGEVNRFIFRDAAGNIFTWKASGDTRVIGQKAPDDRMVEGEQYILTASIKQHDEYKGTKQTVLTRAAVRPFTPASFEAIRDEETRKALGKKVRAGTATADESAQFKLLDARFRAANRQARARVAEFAYFPTTLRTVHVPNTHEAVDAGHGIWFEYKVTSRYEYVSGDDSNWCTRNVVVEDAAIDVHTAEGWAASYSGRDALDKARMFVAARLAAAASEGAVVATGNAGEAS